MMLVLNIIKLLGRKVNKFFYTILLFSLFVGSCSKIEPCLVNYGVFNEYMWRFITYAAKNGRQLDSIELNIYFTDDLKSDGKLQTIGKCDYNRITGVNTVWIKRDYWESSDEDIKELLLFHELGHCILNQVGHRNEINFINGDFRAISLMNSKIISKDYPNNKDYYLQELFSYKGE